MMRVRMIIYAILEQITLLLLYNVSSTINYRYNKIKKRHTF